MAKNVLILTDFSGGTWDAVCFAMKYLRNGETTINLLQTYQKPEVGRSMIRDIVPLLKKNSIDDLKELKRKILNQFKIPKKKVKPLSIEGNLTSLLQNQLNLNDIDSVVVGLQSSIPHTGLITKRKISRVIKCCSHSLFILPFRFSESEFQKIVFVTDPHNQPSKNVVDKLRFLESKVRSGIHILVVAGDDSLDIPENIKSHIIEHFPGIKVTTDSLPNTSMNPTQNFQDMASRNLVVIEKSNYLRFRRFIADNLRLTLDCKIGHPALLIVNQ